MPSKLREEIDVIAADRMRVEREHPGYFWDESDGGRMLTREEARVFGISYEQFPRMVTAWEAWFAFLGMVEPHVFGHSGEAIEEARRRYPELTAGNEPDLFVRFAREVGDLSHCQAEAMYWKDWFWTVREGHVRYADEVVTRAGKAARL